MDSTVSCDVTERYSPALSQTSRGQRVKRERLGTRLLRVVFSSQGVERTRLEVIVCYSDYFGDCCEKLATKDKPVDIMDDFNIDLLKTEKSPYSHNFLLSLQNYHLHPTIDRVRSLFEQKIQGLFKDFQGHISYFSRLIHCKKEP